MATITSSTSGPSNVGTTWVGGVVPVVGDKVIVAHPGTNVLGASTLYTLNGAHAAGAVTLNVTGGTGTILAGECIQIQHPVGTDEDGNTVYDPTYYTVATSLTAGVIVIAAPGLTYAMATGLPVIDRGHVVTIAASHTWGDDTSSLTLASNGIAVSGTLKWSRSASTTTTLRGTCMIGNGGTLDIGYPGAEIIPASVAHTVELNDSVTLATGKHGLVGQVGGSGATWRMCGAPITRNTRLTNSINAGATSITVDASSGWAVGDRIVIASDTDDPARAQIVTISAGSSPTWTVGAITNARAAACRVGNLSSNVTIKSKGATTPGVCGTQFSSAEATSRLNVQDIRFADVGNSGGWVGVSAGGTYFQRSLGVEGPLSSACTMRRLAMEGTTTTAAVGASLGGSMLNRHQCRDAAIYSQSSAASTIFFPQGAMADVDANIYRAAANAIDSANGDGSAAATATGEWWCGNDAIRYAPVISLRVSGASIHSLAGVIQGGNAPTDGLLIESSTISAARIVRAALASASYSARLSGCSISAGTLSGTNTTGSAPQKSSAVKLIAINGDTSDNRLVNYYQTTITDTATRNRSTYSVKIKPLVANASTPYTFTLPAVAGVAQLIKGFLRFDATYGAATPPVITLSGQGVSQTFTAPATADAWHAFSFAFTPTSTGDITATVTVQSTSTAGFAWLDGVYHYPMTQSVRHFGYLWQPQAAQVADSRITLSEAAALALPVSVNHGTSTITVSGACTARQVFEACIADLCQTANQAQAVHITSSTGDTFATPYTIAFAGAGAITGSYTDAAGLHVTATATLPASGCRVQLYDVTNAAELDNSIISSTAYTYPLTYSGARTLRLRVAYQSGTAAKLPQEVFASLTSGGAAFVVPNVDDAVYITNGIDGATCDASNGGEFAADYPNLQIDVSDADGTTTVQRVYAWSSWANTQAQGVRLMFGGVTAADTLNYTIDPAKVNARLQNTASASCVVGGGYLRRADGSTVLAVGAGPIQMDPGRAYLAGGGVVAADVRYVNGVQIRGSGVAGDTWGPA